MQSFKREDLSLTGITLTELLPYDYNGRPMAGPTHTTAHFSVIMEACALRIRKDTKSAPWNFSMGRLIVLMA